MTGAIDTRNRSGGTVRNNLRDGLQSTTWCDAGVQSVQILQWSDIEALRILNLHPFGPVEEVALEIAGCRLHTPLDAGAIEPFLQECWVRDIGNAVRIKHALGGDAGPRSRTYRVDAANAPTFDSASENAVTVPQQELARTNRQLDIAVAPQDVRVIAVHDRVVHVPVGWIRECRK